MAMVAEKQSTLSFQCWACLTPRDQTLLSGAETVRPFGVAAQGTAARTEQSRAHGWIMATTLETG